MLVGVQPMTHSWKSANHFKQVTNHTIFHVGHGLVGKRARIMELGCSRGGTGGWVASSELQKAARSTRVTGSH